jgi:hypothetical protein
LDSSTEGWRLLNATWRIEVARRADIVVAAIRSDATRFGFGRLARALANASRVVMPGGRIVLLTESTPILGPAAQLLRQASDSQQALRRLERESYPDREPAFLWANAAAQGTIYLLSHLSEEETEELFAEPLKDPAEVQRLLGKQRSCLFLPEADKMMALVKDDARH